jgi:GxxExxY protein
MIIMEDKILYKEESYQLIGICMKIHKILGKGFKEIVYKDAIEVEFLKSNIPYEREKPFSIYYEETLLKHKFAADFFIFDKILIEVKATSFIHSDNFKQTLNYLKASRNIKLGILITIVRQKNDCVIFKGGECPLLC